MAGITQKTIAELMGHKSLQMTNRYMHLSPEYKAEAVKVLDRPGARGARPPVGEENGKIING